MCLLSGSNIISPVIGYEEISFFDSTSNQARKISIWYPIDLQTEGSLVNLWDIFKVATSVPITNPQIKKPVIVLSHGFGGSPNQLSWLIHNLISNNYIAIGIQHLDMCDGAPQINHWRRPQDISKILDQFIAQSTICYAADLEKIGIAGFSLGGTTAILLAGGRATKLEEFSPNDTYVSGEEFSEVSSLLPTLDKEKMMQNWQDFRIKAAFLMAPAWSWIFDEENLKKISTPIYLIAPDEDQVLVTCSNAGFFAKHLPQVKYETISGEAHHYVFITAPDESQQKQFGFPLFLNFLIKDSASVNRRALQTTVAARALDFFNSTLN